MKKIIKLLFTSVICITMCICSSGSLSGQTSASLVIDPSTLPQWQVGKIYLKIKDAYSLDLTTYPVISDPGIANIMDHYNVVKVERPFIALGTPKFDRTYRITFTDTLNTDSLINDLQSRDAIEYAERVPMMYPQIIPNDPLLGTQYFWNLINANGVSNIYQTSPGAAGNTIVAIVDDAVLTTHEDLAANIFSSNRDVADLDNDPNPPFTGVAATNGIRFSHGTHVSGIASAVTNNGLGVASVGWSNNIMAIKTRMSNDAGLGLPFAFDGVVWAIANGARVINMSWGGAPASLTEYNILLNAQANDIVLVAAAGNSGMGTAFYPAAYGEGATGMPWEIYDRKLVIAVAALDINNDRSVWTGGFGTPGSNFGNWVDVSAYGTGIRSSIANSAFGLPVINQYADYDGTSMAAPMVSGTAGVLRSYNPASTAIDVYNCIVYSSNPDIYGATHPSNIINTLGHGRLDAQASLQCTGVPCASSPVAIISPSATSICPGGNVTLTANAGVSYLWTTGAITQSIVVNTPGVYSVTVTFPGGCTSVATVTITNVNPTLSIDVFENSGFPNDGIMCGPGSSSNAFSFCTSASGSTYAWSPFGFMGWGQCTGAMSLGSLVPDAFTMTVTVTDMYGCPGLDGMANFTINAVNPPTVAVTPSAPAICAGQSVSLTASGAGTYTWSPATGLSATTGATVIATPATTTTYSVTGVDNITGCEDITPVTVTVNPLPVVNATASAPVICAGSSTNLSATGAVSYSWLPTTGLSSSIISNPVATPAVTTTYTVTGTAVNGCTATATVTVTVTPPPVATFSYTGSPYCTTGVNPLPTFSGGGVAGTFSSSAGLVFVSTSTGQVNLSASTPGTYIVTNTIAASGGCAAVTATATITINICVTPCGTCPLSLPTSGTTPGGSIYCLTSNLTVSSSLTISLSEVRIAPTVTITVNPGATLNITGSHLYSCGDMWQGIVVLPGGTVNVQPLTITLFGLPIVIRTPSIEDAVLAIDVQSTSAITTNPLTVNNATFNRNRTAIQITNFSTGSGAPVYPITFVNSVITCRNLAFTPGSLAWPQTNAIKGTVAVANPLMTPYIDNTAYSPTTPVAAFLKAPSPPGQKPIAGIVLNGVGATVPPTGVSPVYHEVKIGMPGTPNYNVFDNLGICINAFNSNFTCVNNVFQNTFVPQGQGVAINAIVKGVMNCRVQVIPAAATNFINRFFDCGRSINTVNYYENIFNYCDVRATHGVVIPSPPFFGGKYGFFVVTDHFKTVDMSNNSLYNIESGITFNATSGTYSVGGPPVAGQYSGQVDINSNTIRPYLPGFPAPAYVSIGITATNSVTSGIAVVPGSTVHTNSNTMTDVYRGILAMGWSKKDLISNSNTITLLADPFTTFVPFPLQYGIAHNKNTSGTAPIGNNIISNHVTGPGISANPNFYSIAVNQCIGTAVHCNITGATTKGVAFGGHCTPTSFDHNNMSGHQYGFVLDNAGVIGPQGDYTHPSDNVWPGTWTGGNFKTATLATMTASTAVGSELYVRSASAIYNPDGSGFSASGTPFVYSHANGTVLYITNNPLVIACPVSSIFHLSAFVADLENVVQGLDPLINNIAETRYINKNMVYRILKDDPSLAAGSTILSDFYSASSGTAPETFAAIEDDISTGDVANSTIKTAGLVPSNAIEDNYKVFYETYLKQQSDTISTTDSTKLYSIAQGCPYLDGAVVYQARSLYNAIFMTNILFEDNCTGGTRSLQTETNTPKKDPYNVNIYPNPTPGEFTIELNGSDNIQFSVNIMDMQGRSVFKGISDNHILKLKPEAENGVYLVHIRNITTNETFVKKLVIQK